MEPYKPYIPQDLSELCDLIGSMVLGSPRFVDTSGFFPDENLETVYLALEEGLKDLRPELGEERHTRLVELARQTRTCFEDAEDEDGDEVWAGRNQLLQMIEVIGEIAPSR